VGAISAKQGGTAGLPVPAKEDIFCRGIFIYPSKRNKTGKNAAIGVKIKGGFIP